MIGFVATFAMNFQITTALVAKQVFHSGASSFGLASTAFALGALTGALLAARRIKPNRKLLFSYVVIFGLLEATTGLMPTYGLFLVMLVPTGIVLMTFTTAANATMQLSVAPEMRGRVMGLYMLVFLGTNPVGAPTIGWLAQALGPRSTIVLGGLVAAVTPLAVTALMEGRGKAVEGERA
jgi:MFS family permease